MVVWFVVARVLGRRLAGRRIPRCSAPSIRGTPSTFFAEHGWHGVAVLGAVFLVVTGGEALYADMGHFGKRPIRVAWFVLVLPALLLNYFGQGALLLADPAAAANPFYLLAPAWAPPAAGRPRHAGGDHRLAGAHLRRLLAHPPGDAARLLSAARHRAHLVARDRPDLRAAGELGADGQHASPSSIGFGTSTAWPRPTASPSR